ncbi:hypothetical protein TNIN_86911 [Trichonephila inaurata madagascariensis]|uniref:Uncharacterized protein n=1 Tax=Trichonephila inaurata madagascariensis TaxID=2747483 RepID=A0A8X6Y7I6_9ARAC|nr:hypothetical protein TNIN_86911 [Trichonephila inaurata madagascariensis]
MVKLHEPPSRDSRQEEPMDWDDVPFLPEVSAPFVPSRPPRKMRSLISVQVSEPPSLSANRFPTMRALVPKSKLKEYAQKLSTYLSGGEMAIYRQRFFVSPTRRVDKPDFTGCSQQHCSNLTVVTSSACANVRIRTSSQSILNSLIIKKLQTFQTSFGLRFHFCAGH